MNMNQYIKIEAKPEELIALSAIAKETELPEEVKESFNSFVNRAVYAVDYAEKLKLEVIATAAWEAEVAETGEKFGDTWPACRAASSAREEARIAYINRGGVITY